MTIETRKRASLIALLLLICVSSAFGKKDPAVEQRKEFVNRFIQLLERDGWPEPVMLTDLPPEK